MIYINNVSKNYRSGRTEVAGLRQISLEVRDGEFLALAGPSGSGKTTLLNLLGCLDTPTSGEIKIDGLEIAGLSEKEKTALRRDKVGFIFQDFKLIPVLTVYENVEYPLLLERIKKGERKRIIEQVLEQVGLLERAGHLPGELSGGERQRVCIARALVKDPAIILADEPTANLDSAVGEKILDLMYRLNREKGVTIIFSSHDPRVLKKASRVVNIRDGRLSA